MTVLEALRKKYGKQKFTIEPPYQYKIMPLSSVDEEAIILIWIKWKKNEKWESYELEIV